MGKRLGSRVLCFGLYDMALKSVENLNIGGTSAQIAWAGIRAKSIYSRLAFFPAGAGWVVGGGDKKKADS